MRIVFLILFALFLNNIMKAQDYQLKIPEQYSDKIIQRTFETKNNNYTYEIVYPQNYDSTHKYEVVFALSGGSANKEQIEYSYYSIFASKYFQDKFVIMPHGLKYKALHQLNTDEMTDIVEIIQNNLPIKKRNWLLLGTSNGGIAAFRFAYLLPDLFNGIIVIPGALSFDDIHDKWVDYKIMLCCGENDDQSWKNAMQRDLELLSQKVKNVFTYIIEDEGHILSPKYNQDLIYDLYFRERKE